MATATNTTFGTIKLAGDLAGNNNAAAPELSISGAAAGTYTNPTVIVNAKGIITSISTGSAIDVFSIPYASTTAKGLVKIGAGFTINSGVLSIPYATTSTYGIVKIGSGLTITSGVLSVNSSTYPTPSNGFVHTGAIISALSALGNKTGSVTLDFATSNTFSMTLTGNVALENPTNIVAGGTYFIIIKNDNSTAYTMSFGSYFRFESGASSTLSTALGAVDVLKVTVYSATELVCKLYKNFV